MNKVKQSITQRLGPTLRKVREALSPKPSLMKVAKQAGISYQNLSDIERGAEDNYRIKTIEKVARAMGISFSELITMASGISSNSIPVLGYVNSNNPNSTIEWEKGLPNCTPIDSIEISSDLNDPNAYALIVKDNSMGFVGRDWILIVSPKMEIGHLDPVIVVIDEQVLFRRIEISSESYKLFTVIEPNNPLIVSKQKVPILHKVWQLRCPW